MSVQKLAAIVLCGGASRRMGVDKAGQDWLGRRAIDRVMETVAACDVVTAVTVGPIDYGWPQVVEAQAFGGPVGGVLAGARALADSGCSRALVLAVDAPTVRAEDLAPLIAATGQGAAYAGLHLPFVADIAALTAQFDAEAGWPLRRLLDGLGLERLKPPESARARLRGANRPEERDLLLAELAGLEGA